MARNIDDIQRDIERTRRQLASTLDQLADRSRPQALVGDAKRSAADKVQEPKVQAVLGGAAAVVVCLIALSVARSRQKKRDLKEIQRMLAERA
ncbi:DUF3618 domain-containing protein [Corynebacterium sp. H128]|uniref:DUF3618 domain-containing protein n=1 Tax=unclassified Corynebacterium TaxID=2624378 RepID=UPI0030A67081